MHKSTTHLMRDYNDSDSESDIDDSGYDTAPEAPPESRSRSRSPPPAAMHAVTSVDVLGLLRADASSPVPFPYKIHWPALP